MTVCIVAIDLIRHTSLNGGVSLKEGYFRKIVAYVYSALEISGLSISIAIQHLVKNKNTNTNFAEIQISEKADKIPFI